MELVFLYVNLSKNEFIEKCGFNFSPNYYFEIERSEEHTSELQSQGTISYAVFCLKKVQRKSFQKIFLMKVDAYPI